MIGFFNVSQRPLSQLIPLSKFPGVIEAQYYIVRAHTSGLISSPLQVVDPAALIYVSLEIRGYDILSAFPLRGFVDGRETTWIANLGLLGKMAGAAAIVDNRITKLENGRIVIDTNLKALGTLGRTHIPSHLEELNANCFRNLHLDSPKDLVWGQSHYPNSRQGPPHSHRQREQGRSACSRDRR